MHVCDDEVPDEHYVVSHLLTPLTLTVRHESFSWRDTWDDLADEYFEDHVNHWNRLIKRKFGVRRPRRLERFAPRNTPVS